MTLRSARVQARGPHQCLGLPRIAAKASARVTSPRPGCSHTGSKQPLPGTEAEHALETVAEHSDSKSEKDNLDDLAGDFRMAFQLTVKKAEEQAQELWVQVQEEQEEICPRPSWANRERSRRAAAAAVTADQSEQAVPTPVETKLEGAMKVFSEHAFFAHLRVAAVSAFARVARYWRRDADERHVISTNNSTIIQERENNWASELLWVIERGTVLVEEGGELLGQLGAGQVFGDSVAFGRASVQPFTVRLGEEDLVAWYLPHAAVQYALRQFPETQVHLEERLNAQLKQLLNQRAAKLLFFSRCGPGFFPQLVPKMEIRHYEKRDELFATGDPANHLIMVVLGAIRLKSRPRDGARHKFTRALLKHKVRGRQKPEEQAQEIQNWTRGSIVKPQVVDKQASLPSGNAKPRRTLFTTGDVASARNRSSLPDMESLQDAVESVEPVYTTDYDSAGTSTDSEDEKNLEDDLAVVISAAVQASRDKMVSVGPEAVIFGEDALLNLSTVWDRTAIADCCSIAMILPKADFLSSVERHPRERKRFEEMTQAKYQEWRRDVHRLERVDMFRSCDYPFLETIARVCEASLYFADEEIIAQGLVPKGLLLLMHGVAEEVRAEATGDTKVTVSEVTGPHSFGSLEWLGLAPPTHNITRAKTFCIVLTLAWDDLLKTLQLFPQESTRMVQQVLRNGRIRLSLTQSLNAREVACAPDSGPAGVLHLQAHSRVDRRRHRNNNFWHMPFCSGCEPGFIAKFTLELKISKLVPGQQVFECDEEADFVLSLIAGSVQVDDDDRVVKGAGREHSPALAPLVITGFNRKRRHVLVAASMCEVHRLSIPAVQRLAAEFPKDCRTVLERMVQFQARREEKLGSSWWNHISALRHQAWFQESEEEFLICLGSGLTTELFLPGEILVREGDPADSTMLLECGDAAVEKVDTRNLFTSDRIGEIHDGYWIGEMAVFAGESKRRAGIKALTPCKVQRLRNQALVECLGRFPSERQRFRELAERRLQAVDNERLEDLDFFKDFERSFLNLLRPKCRPLIFFAGEVLMKQGDIAESLFILGSGSHVIFEVDGFQVKELVGRACLGSVALLSPRPVRRASTVITKAVCSVRTILREDWHDVLKHNPDHRQWLKTFTREQLEKVRNARAIFSRKQAWEKIHKRNKAAAALHCERMISGFETEVWQRRRNERMPHIPTNVSHPALADGAHSPGVHTKSGGEDSPCNGPQAWQCFNGSQSVVPHTRLPQLAFEAQASANIAVAELDGSRSQRSSCCYEECGRALGCVDTWT